MRRTNSSIEIIPEELTREHQCPASNFEESNTATQRFQFSRWSACPVLFGALSKTRAPSGTDSATVRWPDGSAIRVFTAADVLLSRITAAIPIEVRRQVETRIRRNYLRHS